MLTFCKNGFVNRCLGISAVKLVNQKKASF
jgi:hypothetical protein